MSDKQYVFITSDGESVPVYVAVRRGVRNITLRPKTRPRREIHMTRPWLVRDSAALNFLESKRKWVERVFARAPDKEKLTPGVHLEFLGRMVTVEHNPAQRANRFSDDGMRLIIGGAPEMFERRVRDVIKNEILVEIKRLIRTTPREFWPRRVCLRDTTTRWGSCSSTGTMSFSWRLAFAPHDVLRYVVMHELAHTRHMDHSPAFWATVGELYGFGVERAKRWLAQHGGELHKYF